jgi:hypothetical protein
MHNGRMSRRIVSRQLLAVLMTSALLAGCSGNDEPKSDSSTGTSSASTPTAAESNYLAVPDGVELTAPGSELSLGQSATVAYEPRQGTVAALKIKVTQLRRASFDQFIGWKIDKKIRTTTPYFVDATVTNVGDSDLGGRPVPLYIVDGENRLIEASIFTATFHPCSGATLPKKFENGDTAKTCLVFLSPDHGDLTAVSFRPTQAFDPITWTGKVQKFTVPTKKRGDKGSKTGAGKKGKKG